jgi:hypothetical protein
MKYSFNVPYFLKVLLTILLGYFTLFLIGLILLYVLGLIYDLTALFILNTGILVVTFFMLRKLQRDELKKNNLERVNSIRLMKIVLIVFYLYCIFESTNLFYNYK